MRLVRFLVVMVIVGTLAWMMNRAVSVESSEDQVRITIDRHKLRQAGIELKSKSRQAVGTVGQVLEKAGEPTGDESSAARRFWSR